MVTFLEDMLKEIERIIVVMDKAMITNFNNLFSLKSFVLMSKYNSVFIIKKIRFILRISVCCTPDKARPYINS